MPAIVQLFCVQNLFYTSLKTKFKEARRNLANEGVREEMKRKYGNRKRSIRMELETGNSMQQCQRMKMVNNYVRGR